MKPGLWLALIAVLTAVIVFSIHAYRYRFVRSDGDMLALLPGGDAALFFVDFAALRHGGVLNLVGETKPVRDPDYDNFVKETGFDYTSSVDVVVGEATATEVYFIVRGRFDWPRLRRYAMAHGGSCAGGFCKVPPRRTGHWISFLPIQPDVMALAVSANPSAAEVLRPRGRPTRRALRSEPVWVSLPLSLIRKPSTFPESLQLFANLLQTADSVFLSVDRAAPDGGAVFNLKLDAAFPLETAAETTRNQFEIQTKMFKLELAREHRQPNPADLTGLLTGGSFQVVSKHVIGTWPVRKELLNMMK